MYCRTPVALFICSALFAVHAQQVASPKPPASAPVRLDSLSIPVYGGRLRGENNGEWGGSLTFEDLNGRIRQRLLEENIVGMFETPSAVIVFTGLSHLRFNAGAIYAVRATTGDRLKVTLVHRLAGAPSDLNRLDSGTITFRVFTAAFEPSGDQPRPIYTCQALDPKLKVQSLPCPPTGR
jgi:hypothetical protein